MRAQQGATSPQNGSQARFDPRWYKRQIERLEEEEMNMTEQAACPLCRHENPPGNRFCGSCGVRLTSGEQLATRQEHRPVQAGRAWTAKLGPAGKALAVGVAAIAAEAALSWLQQRRIGTEERSSLPAVRDAGSASRGYLLGQSLEEVLVQVWEDSHSQVVARREVRSFLTTGPTGRRR
jgi:hypothetical protein